MYANYHTHTFRCNHATGTEEEYIKTAIKNGIKIMGFSDHAPFVYPDGFQAGYCIQAEEAEDYIETLKALREKYKGQIEIIIGFEMEYYPIYFDDMLSNVKKLGAEYLILGQHFIGNGYPDGIGSCSPNHTEEMFSCYTDGVIEGMKTGKFSYLAHPDMFLYAENDEIYNREAKRLCEAAKELDIPLEINLLGIHSRRHYPKEAFWKIAGEVGCKVIFGFDAHSADRAYDKESLKIAEKIVKKYKLHLIDELDIKEL
ncbi:MAG: histidinol-phosphatase [Clostridia bacterium]|nr:histidinol-phosphatase [Clostridia bacterium]